MSAEPLELPPFAPLRGKPKKSVEERKEISRRNMKKAMAANTPEIRSATAERLRERKAERDRLIEQDRIAAMEKPEEAPERAIVTIQAELMPYAREVADIFINDLKRGTRAERRSAAKEIRDMLVGKPRQSTEEDVRPTTIVWQDDVFGEIVVAKQEHGR